MFPSQMEFPAWGSQLQFKGISWVSCKGRKASLLTTPVGLGPSPPLCSDALARAAWDAHLGPWLAPAGISAGANLADGLALVVLSIMAGCFSATAVTELRPDEAYCSQSPETHRVSRAAQ